MQILPVDIALPDGTQTRIPLIASSRAGSLAIDGDVLAFSIPDGSHLYLTSKGNAKFAEPAEDNVLSLSPDTEYTLHGDSSLTGGAAAVWIIEYDQASRLGHQSQGLTTGPFAMTWHTHSQLASCCLAIRLSGEGRLTLSSLRLSRGSARLTPKTEAADDTVVGEVRYGPLGEFRDYSVFLDPAGYRSYVESHHRFYNDRPPSWYNSVVEPLRTCASVLDIGCGPGLLMQALTAAGVPRVMGLERDPHYLQTARDRGLRVFEHDLNQPMPFIESGSFDGIIAHQVCDYLPPIALRNVLRECHRVLRPGGVLSIHSRSDGQASGDITRTVALNSELVERLLREAGFQQFKLQTQPRGFRVLAQRSDQTELWPVRTVKLQDGRELHPWTHRQTILPPTPDAWDQLSRRDFAILTTPDKREVRVNDNLVAYYTGYRESEGNTHRAILRAVSEDGLDWQRDPVSPVLQAGAPGDWDAGGVLAGSVIAMDATSPTPYIMYYSGRSTDNAWKGVAIARSADGIHWQKDPQPVLRLEDYPGLKHLALADVIRTTSGCWLMHCEGWTSDRGWAVVQATSPDGFQWKPTQPKPVIHPSDISWGGFHVANPKCLELDNGHLVLGFNAADESLRFQLGLAESTDGLNWSLLDANPLLCAGTNEYRIESFFMTRDAWDRSDRRLYYFSSKDRSTDTASNVLVARADSATKWISADWKSNRQALYTIRDNRLTAEPGARLPEDSLSRSIPLEAETQCALRIEATSPSEGSVLLRLSGNAVTWELAIQGDGQCIQNGGVALPSSPQSEPTSVCLRVLRPQSPHPEVSLQIWRDGNRVLDRQCPLGFTPRVMQVSVQVPPDQPSLTLDHIDIWQPVPERVEGYADAHMYMGEPRSNDPLLPDIAVTTMAGHLKEQEIGRSIVVPYGNDRLTDTYDSICSLAATCPTRVYPLYRRRPLSPGGDDDHAFELHQLEVLWQEGQLFGLHIHLGMEEPPPPPILEWLQQRQLLSMWQVTRSEQLDWLEHNVLEKFTFPVMLTHFGGYPLDRARYTKAIEMLRRYPHLYLITSCVWFQAYLEQAIEERPHQVLFGSDSPAVNSVAARATIEHLDVPAAHKALVLGENLRFLTERAQWHRWNALRKPETLMFPRLPATPQDLADQGFKMTTSDALPPAEPEVAKTFWGTRGRVGWYERNQPWRTMLADLVKDLGAQSVLEFGCNVGQNLAAIHAACPDVRIVGLDINPDAVRLGKEKTGLDLRLGDEKSLDAFADGEFDLVFTVSVIDHVGDAGDVCRRLLRVAGRHLYLLEVRLPVDGKVVEHYDHHHGQVRTSTGASYSWQLEKYLQPNPRIWRLDRRPVYLHSLSLGPYYWEYLVFLEQAVAPQS
jgi:SAM-dependent methyltransferase